MAEDKYYCGCGHSTWGLLLLFSVVQVFLTSSLFPGVVEIFDASVNLRSSRSAVEKANSNLDAWATYDTSVYSTPTALSTALNTPGSGLTTNPPPNLDVLNLQKADADLVFATVMARYLPGVTAPTASGNTVVVVPTFVNATGFTTAASVYIMPAGNFAFTNGNRKVTTTIPASVSLGTVSFTTASNITSLKVASTMEKQVTSLLSTALARTEAFAAFFFLQWILGLAFFAVALKKYNENAAPTALPVLGVFGMLMMFFGWVVGWYYNSPWVLTTLFDTFLSGSMIGSIGAQPFVGLLILVWILMFIYAHYAVQFVNNGGKEDVDSVPASAPQSHPVEPATNNGNSTGMMASFKSMTGKLTGANKTNPPAGASLAVPPATNGNASLNASGSFRPNSSGNYAAPPPNAAPAYGQEY